MTPSTAIAAEPSPLSAPQHATAAAADGPRRRIALAGCVAALLLTVGGLFGLQLLAELTERERQVAQSVVIRWQLERLRGDIRGAGRAVLDALVEERPAVAAPAPWRADLDISLATLRDRLADAPNPSGDLAALANAVRQNLDHMQDLATSSAAPLTPALDLRRRQAAAIEAQIDAFDAREATRLAAYQLQFDRALQHERWCASAVFGAGLIALLLALQMGRQARRQRQAAAQQRRRDTAALRDANEQLEARVAQRTESLQLVSMSQTLRNDAAQVLMAALDEADDRPALLAWRQRHLDCGLAAEMLLRLAGHDDIGHVSVDPRRPAELQVKVELPHQLGHVVFTRYRVPADLAAAGMHREQVAADLAAWLELRRQRQRRQSAERQRDRTEVQMSALFEQSPVGMALLDTALQPVRVNPAMAAIGFWSAAPGSATDAENDSAQATRRRQAVLPALCQARDSALPVLDRSLQLPMATRGGSVGRMLVSVLPLHQPAAADGDPLFGLAMIATDITEQEQARERLSAVTRQMMQVAEDERRNLARELHDDLGQRLAALKMNLQLLDSPRGVNTARPLLGDSVRIVDACIGQMRQRAASLRPPQLDQLGLVAALRDHAGEQARRSGVQVDVDARLPERGLRDEWSSQLFRIVQEALRNAIAHGRPRTVTVALVDDGDAIALTVRDDGTGSVEPSHAGMGLLNMRERTELLGGTFGIGAAPGGGTLLRCRWPRDAVLVDETHPGDDA